MPASATPTSRRRTAGGSRTLPAGSGGRAERSDAGEQRRALAPALRAGLGLALQPDFMVWDDLEAGRLERVLPDWSPPPIALHLVMPPGEPRPARVTALIAFLTQTLAAARWANVQQPSAALV